MAKILLIALLQLNLGCFLIWAAPAESAPSSPASPAPLADDAYERARQKLREQLQSLGQSVDGTAPTANAASSAAPTSNSNATIVASIAGSVPSVVGELPDAMRSLDDKQKLAVNDRVSFRVLEDREDAKPLAVNDSGEIEIPYLGRYRAVDKTCFQLASELKTALEKDYYRRATVVVNLDAMSRSRGKVYVYGHVRTPGPVELPGDEVLTVSKLILRVGGFAEFADKRRVKVTRKVDGGDKNGVQSVINVEEILEKGKADKDMIIKADDMIFVPARLINF